MLYYLGKGTEFKKEECKEYKTLKNALAAAAKDEALTVWDENGVVVGGLTDNVPEGALNTNPDGSVNAYDENGNPAGTVDAATVAEMTGNVPEAGENGGNEDEAGNESSKPENGGNEANTTSQTGEDDGGQQDDETETAGEDAGNAENGGKEDETENEPSEPENGEHGADTGAETGKDDGGQQDSVIIPQGTMKVTVVCDGALNLRRSPAWGNDNICGRAVRGQSYYVKEIHTVGGKKMVRTIDDLYLSGQSEHVQFEQL
jgi:hypothetical protein